MWYDWLSICVMITLLGLFISIPIKEYLSDVKDYKKFKENDPLTRMMKEEENGTEEKSI